MQARPVSIAQAPKSLSTAAKLPRAVGLHSGAYRADTLRFGFAEGAAKALRSELYPAMEPFRTERLTVSSGHELYIEESGNSNGYPVIVLHGGPGAGSTPLYRQMFDPAFYRIIQFDQRGCGKSTPRVTPEDLESGLKDNTPDHLAADIEQIRTHLGIRKWLVWGGSWGSTLALHYAETHPERTTGLILRGIFLGRKEDVDALYQDPNGPAAQFQPEEWERFVSLVPPERRHEMVKAYQEMLHSNDLETRKKAASAWARWETSVSCAQRNEKAINECDDANAQMPFSVIENHFFRHSQVFASENQLLDNIDKIRHVPTWIVHGEKDVVCPVKQAHDLAKALNLPPERLRIIAGNGHSAREPGVGNALVVAGEEFKKAQPPKTPGDILTDFWDAMLAHATRFVRAMAQSVHKAFGDAGILQGN